VQNISTCQLVTYSSKKFHVIAVMPYKINASTMGEQRAFVIIVLAPEMPNKHHA
jgi:hypothetical protein